MKVYVVTDPELGWDCVCAVFATQEKAEAFAYERGNDPVITPKTLDPELD